MAGETILVIDDDVRVFKSLSLVLTDYRLLSASSGEEGLQILGKPHEVELVLLDVKMEGIHGTEVLRRIRKLKESIGVIMLTGFSTKEVLLEALQGKADNFIEKPFSPDDVRRKVDDFFRDRSRSERLNSGSSSVKRIKRFLERNFEKEITLEDAAQVASLSPKYLSRFFREKTDQTFTDYRIEVKMTEAKKLLKSSALSVSEIADKIGYQNPESFMKMFKKINDCTPSEYRKKHTRRVLGGSEKVE